VIRSSKNIHLECVKHEDELKLLPLEICTSLVTKNQQDWWQAAYSLYTGKIGYACLLFSLLHCVCTKIAIWPKCLTFQTLTFQRFESREIEGGLTERFGNIALYQGAWDRSSDIGLHVASVLGKGLFI